MTKKEEVLAHLDELEKKEKGSALKVAIPTIMNTFNLGMIDAGAFKREWVSKNK